MGQQEAYKGAATPSGYTQLAQPTPNLLFSTPVEGVPIKSPKFPPGPGDVLLGYEFRHPKLGFNRTLTTTGWMASLVLVAFAWPFFWVPAVMKSLHDAYQRPVYGRPGVHQYQVVEGFPLGGSPMSAPAPYAPPPMREDSEDDLKNPAAKPTDTAYAPSETRTMYPAVNAPTTPQSPPPNLL